MYLRLSKNEQGAGARTKTEAGYLRYYEKGLPPPHEVVFDDVVAISRNGSGLFIKRFLWLAHIV